MKLYHYDHCPFCVRVRMILGLRGLPYESQILPNDDAATPISLIGAKQVPILQKADGTHMGESLDIVRYLDEYAGKERLIEAVRPEIQAWADKVGGYYGRLLHPRSCRLPLPEFGTQSAIDYFVKKKQNSIGSFDIHLNKTADYLQTLHEDFQVLEGLVESSGSLNGSGLSMEDILVFPMLRNLSMVRGAVYPEKISAYLHDLARQSGVNLYFEYAL